ncbi:hypothetical protein [Cryobacterium sp. BB736]|uniref:hypothetical protein n=1 Tax=Cryobacterium sp. BB736 TaxID=2746963 RepID=UPI001876746F|nr:hypothetical protein [Cryobacterium sp. BB736]
MNLTDSIVPRSDQANAEDFLAGPRTFTIEKVVAGTAEQPVEVHLREMPGRPYKPSKSMRRVLVMAWGAEASNYTGRRLTLFRNPDITFGKERVGGIEISHLSHIDKALTVALTVTRGRRKPFTVAPLTDAPATAPTRDELDPVVVSEWVETLEAATSLSALQTAWADAGRAGVAHDPRVIAAKDKQKAALT